VAASPNSPADGVDVNDAWRRFKDRLYAFALRQVRAAAEAEDVVQDVLVRFLQHRDGIDSDRLAAWLFTTARNAVIDRRRRSQRAPAACDPDDAADVLAAASNTDAGQELTACVQPLLAMLSADDRAILEQVELLGKSQAETAIALSAPPSTIKSRVQRARQRLRKHFERCCEIELDRRGSPLEFTSRGRPDYPRCEGCDEQSRDARKKEG
jgi:RNA polymerase sigma-70 factor (ECF subfamily)